MYGGPTGKHSRLCLADRCQVRVRAVVAGITDRSPVPALGRASRHGVTDHLVIW